VTAEQVATFRDNGFLTLDRLSSESEIEWLRSVYEDLLADPAGLTIHYEGEAGPDQVGVIDQMFLPDRQCPELLDTEYINKGRALAAELLGIDAGDVVDGGLMFIHKPASGGRSAPWHQDEAYWKELGPSRLSHSLSIWMPLDDVTVESGCMQFIPGTHKSDDVRRHRKPPGMNPIEVDEPFDVGAAVPCPLNAGDATVHHCRTLHHTAANTSGRPRRAMTTIFHGPPGVRAEPVDRFWLT